MASLSLTEIDSMLGDTADLTREDSTMKISVVFLPSMKRPESAHVTIVDPEFKLIDDFTLLASDGYEAFSHPCLFSAKFVKYLQTRGKNSPNDNG